MAIPVELLVLTLGVIIVLLGDIVPNLRILKNLGAILLIVLSVVILSNGIEGVDNLLTVTLASVSFGIGTIVFITDNFSEGEQEEFYSQEPRREVFR